MNRIITDSTIWKEYFQKGNTKEAKILEELIKEDRIVICGYTLVKVLKDIKDRETFEKILKGLLTLPYVEIEKRGLDKSKQICF